MIGRPGSDCRTSRDDVGGRHRDEIAYRPGTETQNTFKARRFVWFDRSGKEVGRVGDPTVIESNISLSADGSRLAVDATGPDATNVYQVEIDHGARNRLTLHAAPVFDLAMAGHAGLSSSRPYGV